MKGNCRIESSKIWTCEIIKICFIGRAIGHHFRTNMQTSYVKYVFDVFWKGIIVLKGRWKPGFELLKAIHAEVVSCLRVYMCSRLLAQRELQLRHASPSDKVLPGSQAPQRRQMSLRAPHRRRVRWPPALHAVRPAPQSTMQRQTCAPVSNLSGSQGGSSSNSYVRVQVLLKSTRHSMIYWNVMWCDALITPNFEPKNKRKKHPKVWPTFQKQTNTELKTPTR